MSIVSCVLSAQHQRSGSGDTTNVLISGKRESVVVSRPKREIPGYRWLFGAYGMGALQQHYADFAYVHGMFPIAASDSVFGSHSNFAAGMGIVIDHRLSSSFQMQVRAGLSAGRTDFLIRENIGYASPDYDTAFVHHRLRTSLVCLHLNPSVGMRLYEQLFLNLGVEGSYAVVGDYAYTDSLFPLYVAPYKDRAYPQSGVLRANLALSASLGAEWYVPLSRSTFLTPFVRYHIPLTSITDAYIGGALVQRFDDTTRTPLRNGAWMLGTLQAGVAFQWGEGSINPVLRETIYERDTSTVIVEASQERLRLRSSETGIITSEEQGLLIERTVVHESYVREVPKQQALRADIRVQGVNWDGQSQDLPTVVVEELETETYHPLLPYVFFPQESATLAQTRQTLLSTPKIAAVWTLESLPNAALQVHSNLLNILGARMKANPQARITVTGCVSNIGAERENVELAMRRAKAVQTYLSTIWKIKPDRIRVVGRLLPEKPSNTSIEEGIEENRRVEIRASIPDILLPVMNRAITRSINPPLLEIQPVVDAPAGLRSWTVTVQRNGSTLQQWTGEYAAGNVLQPLQWRLSESVLGESDTPLTIRMQVLDLEGREVVVEKPVTVRQVTIAKKRLEQVQDKRLERFSLMLFDFDRAEINADNLPILNLIKQRIQQTSQVTVIGYSDHLGSREYNRELALRRSLEVKNFLQLPEERIKLIPIGSDVLLHDNATPEGRSYCRIVQVLVATPINSQ
ncbi:MAG: OmpA family protein [Bacteroidota bacterium]|nr:OmpA family protein [Candidatus Kapabacteria bacterium]MDW8220735.1 OmpA family protein [Bacteroidota bacterium]